ncbi:hypothetical protein [Paracoccus sediminis]|uniref:Uncharacterized protein n=1 Tax=Paracoccus sediminis TaxID=1214787 RepID=A0A238YIV2_9RHOB|nr:hypothetical protein [Paracoccus sediminis]SNR71057.1 hypothetical protein SAMN06265378_11925 [Paracoccus sediminis]
MIYQVIYANWIDGIRDTGGVSDCPRDVSNAFKAAKNFCMAEARKRGVEPNPVVNWAADVMAAFMVSCVKNDESNIWEIMMPGDDICEVFRVEAERNTGMIHEVLMKGAKAHPRLLRTGLIALCSQLRVAPTGSGKGVGNIRRLF